MPPRKDDCVLMLDENRCSQIISDPLNRLTGWTIERFKSHLKKGTEDDKVVAFCGERGWGLISTDDMRYTPETQLAIVAYDVRVFKVVVRKNTAFTEIMASLVLGRAEIQDIMRRERKALVAHVRRKGDVQIMTRLEHVRAAYSESQLRTARKYGHKAGMRHVG